MILTDEHQGLPEEDIIYLKKISTEFSMIDGSCIYVRFSTEMPGAPDYHRIVTQFRVNGSIFMLLTKGTIELEINTQVMQLEAPVCVSLTHGTLVRLSSKTENQAAECYALIYYPEFLRDINISFSAVSGEAFAANKGPALKLRDREISQFIRYYSLIHSVMSENYNPQLNRHIVSSLTAAIFYQVSKYMHSRIETDNADSNSPRKGSYVEDFMRLLHVYYTRERSVNFYASKLYISPKYLSLLIKEATGRSAARWIDSFVIMEAKNLLRYSGKNVQQVAYALNFSNQSSFGKYFKHLTGMSPTEYQKTQ